MNTKNKKREILIEENISILKRITFLQDNLLQLSYKSNNQINRSVIFNNIIDSLKMAKKTLLVNKEIQRKIDSFDN